MRQYIQLMLSGKLNAMMVINTITSMSVVIKSAPSPALASTWNSMQRMLSDNLNAILVINMSMSAVIKLQREISGNVTR